MSKLRHLLGRIHPYVAVILMVGITMAVRAALHPQLGAQAPLIIFTLPVILSAFYLGFRAALLATILGGLLGSIVFIDTFWPLTDIDPADRTRLVIFSSIGIIVSFLGRELEISRKALQESELTARALLESATQAVIGIGKDGKIRLANRAVESMFGYRSEELIGQTLEVLIPEESRQRHVKQRNDYFTHGNPRPMGVGMDLKGLRKDGSVFPIEASLSMTETLSGPLAVSFISDITKRKDIEAALARKQSQLMSILDYSPILISKRDRDGRYSLANKALLELLHMNEDMMIGKRPDEIFSSSLAAKIESDDKTVLETNEVLQTEESLLGTDGRVHTYLVQKYPVRDIQTGEVYGIGSFSLDITEQKYAEQRALHAAQHDPLTGLPNRTIVYEFGSKLINSAVRHRKCLAVLFFDLDRFKPINDTYGHEAGDKMLQEVAQRLRTSLRSGDVIGRIGGDEFVAILDDVRSETDVGLAARNLLEVLRQPYHVDTLELRTSPSIGISLCPHDGTDIDVLIRHADAAMYQAKANGRNNYQFFTSDINRNTQRIFAMEQRLRQSIIQNEFELWYQPVVDTTTRKLVSVEALLRWRQLNNEIVLPGDFISAAETSGLINQLGQWVIRTACEQHQSWRALGLPSIPIAVNVSPVQFRSKDFQAEVALALSDSGIEPSYMELEVTESTVMNQVEEAVTTLTNLKKLGIKIALDDFGTGYSSLSYLSYLPIDKLKVDQSFVQNIDSDARSLAIAETVIALGKKLNVEVVAEGIETEKAMRLLTERECGLGQGYLISRPMPSEIFIAWYYAQHRPEYYH
ncbi:MAG TPA: EAL domain-containing protein [Methylophilaceae bacterium]|nr:EAL domain-containing protein [Methylophilaceae bacterium]